MIELDKEGNLYIMTEIIVPTPKKSKKKLPSILLVSLVLNLALGFFGYKTYTDFKQYKEDPQKIEREEVAAVVAEVSKLINLPDNIEPVLATVSDAEALKAEQPFFANSENGDKVLLYTQTEDEALRKAYLYRPSEKRLLNVAPINIGGNNQVQTQDDSFSMGIYNGTNIEGLQDEMEGLMAKVYPNATIASKANASRNDYAKSVLVKLNASDELTQKVATFFNLEIVDLPAGEQAPEGADLLLILGTTQQEQAAAQTPEPTQEPVQEEPAEE